MSVTVRADFVDEAGRLLFQEVETATGRKMRRPDGNGGWEWNLDGVRRVLWNLQRLWEHLANSTTGPVYLTEGTSDARELDGYLEKQGLPGVVTTNPHGAGTWMPEWTEALTGARLVVVIVDVDEAGYRRACHLYHQLSPVVEELRLLYSPHVAHKGDVRDHLAAGYGLDDFADVPIRLADDDGPPPRPFRGPAPNVAELLDELIAFVRRYVVIAPAQADGVALWTAHAWAIDAFDFSPYLAVVSPEKRCGKTLLLDVLELVSPRAWRVVTPSEAVVFRKIARDKPTVLLDELDSIFGKTATNHEGLRAILNAGNRRGTRVPRCGGANRDQLEEFDVFGPKALAGIGDPPATILDRSIRIEMKRRAPGEKVERFRHRTARAAAVQLAARFGRWAEDAVDLLAEAEPEIPAELDDRAADGWEPLLAVADLAGGDWPRRGREAALALSTGDAREDDSIGVRLLADCRRVFATLAADRAATVDLIHELAADDSPWTGWWDDEADKPAKGGARKLASSLKRYGIRPESVWIAGKSTKGYRSAAFEDAWARYVPEIGEIGENPHGQRDSAPSAIGEAGGSITDSREAANPHEQTSLTDLTDSEQEWLATASLDEIRERYEGAS